MPQLQDVVCSVAWLYLVTVVIPYKRVRVQNLWEQSEHVSERRAAMSHALWAGIPKASGVNACSCYSDLTLQTVAVSSTSQHERRNDTTPASHQRHSRTKALMHNNAQHRETSAAKVTPGAVARQSFGWALFAQEQPALDHTFGRGLARNHKHHKNTWDHCALPSQAARLQFR